MSRGPGRLEQAIFELFKATEDKALSVADIADVAFKLKGHTASRAQRLSATRAAHSVLGKGHKAEEGFKAAMAAATATLGRAARRRDENARFFRFGSSKSVRFYAVDEEFLAAMKASPAWTDWLAFWRFDRVAWWTTTQTEDGRIYFHPDDFAVRVWAVDIVREGVLWAEVESIDWHDDENVYVTYAGARARLNRKRLSSGGWALWRGLMFTNQRSGRAAFMFDRM
jgi:hypothetical protein